MKNKADYLKFYFFIQMFIGGFIGPVVIYKFLSPHLGAYVFSIISTIVICFFSAVALRRSRINHVSQVNFIGFGIFGIFLFSSVVTTTLLTVSGRMSNVHSQTLLQNQLLGSYGFLK